MAMVTVNVCELRSVFARLDVEDGNVPRAGEVLTFEGHGSFRVRKVHWFFNENAMSVDVWVRRTFIAARPTPPPD